MPNSASVDMTDTIVLFFGVIALIYSLWKYGYEVWFNASQFLQDSEREKNKPQHWLKFFMNSTSSKTDLLMARIIFFIALLTLIAFLVELIPRLVNLAVRW